MTNTYHLLNFDTSTSGTVYRLYVLIEAEPQRTKTYLLEKEVTVSDVTTRTYFESNEQVESIADAWTNRAAKTYANFYEFRGVFANNF
jgi:cation transport regulator ChaC